MTNKDFSFDAQCRRGNRLMMIVGMGLFVTSLALAGWYGTWMEALLIGGSAIAMPALLTRMAPLVLATRIAHGLIAVHHLGFNYLQAGRPLCRSG